MVYPDEKEIYERISIEINEMLKAITKIDEQAIKECWGIKPVTEDKITEIGKAMASIEYLQTRL